MYLMDILPHLGRQKIRYTALIFGRLLEIYLGKAPIMASGSSFLSFLSFSLATLTSINLDKAWEFHLLKTAQWGSIASRLFQEYH